VRPDEVVQHFPPIISSETNTKLCKEFSMEEISNALFQIGPLEAPSPDGFPARFFQRNWEVLRDDVIRVVKEFFDSGHMTPRINDTTIVLLQ
jgi:hypothetical protein